MVYFIQSGTVGPYKIGYTRDTHTLRGCLCSLQFGNPEVLTVAGVLPSGGRHTKERLHVLFRPVRVRTNGEWFESVPELTALVEWVRENPFRLDEYIAVNFESTFRPPSGRPKKPSALRGQKKKKMAGLGRAVEANEVTILHDTGPSKADMARERVNKRIEDSKHAARLTEVVQS